MHKHKSCVHAIIRSMQGIKINVLIPKCCSSVERPISGEDPRERAGSSLEEVVIDDKDGSASLDDFLSDVVMEEYKETEEGD